MRRPRNFLFVFAVVGILFSGVFNASYAAEKRDKIAEMITGENRSGVVQSFDELVGEKGLVVLAFPSLDASKRFHGSLIQYGDSVSDFTNKGYALVAIVPNSPERIDAFYGQYDYEGEMISNQDMSMFKALGILQSSKVFPTVYILNKSGRIEHIVDRRDIYEKVQISVAPSTQEVLELIE